MCGFVGYINKEKNKKDNIKKMNDLISHRGPDSEGYYYDENIALGFRRLSIIDLKSGDQPIYNDDKSKIIIFNGEIYNFKELRIELEEKGYKFQTNTDTEVILRGYEEYKEGILDKLRGMFAFVIYDKNEKELFGARDFYGIKPLYYSKMGNSFIFGSEIKSFLIHPHFKKELNEKMLEYYLTFQYSPGEETFFKNVYKLMPGHYFKFKNGKLKIKKYYEIKFDEDSDKTYDEWRDGIKSRLEDSIKAHKISDVEVGSFLSSGVDSSYIAASSNVDKTFTVGFNNKKYSEISYAEDLSEKIGTKNINKVISKEDYFKNLPNILYYMDEPLADPSAIALYFVTKIASENVKVSLSGEGADEIFGGYNIYQEPLTAEWYYKIPFFLRRFIGLCASFLPKKRGINFLVRRGKKLEDRFVGNAFIFDEREIKKIYKGKMKTKGFKDLTCKYYNKVSDKDDITKMQYIDFNFWLIGDILLKADKMSMANSLEVRVPFLDRPLIDYALGLPTKFKTDKFKTKKIFRDIAGEVLDDKVSNKKKLGFPVPIREWMKDEDTYKQIKALFEKDDKFFNSKRIIKLLDDHKKGKKDNSRKIWTIYVFLLWYEIFFGGDE
ncbi:MAG: asparagine synthase (glutamine-hydrolyzing) [Bacilli bacterium]|nr:asparagine synthase (glutamine-hydrolyzing) [Bacilli bacterium]